MTPEELLRQMQLIVAGGHPKQARYHSASWKDDPEVGHGLADDLLMETLRELGYGLAMDVYVSQTRWTG